MACAVAERVEKYSAVYIKGRLTAAIAIEEILCVASK